MAENIAALDDGTLASELFGHEKGAFTGAGERRAGLFESAHRGTLFLDEIGELPPRVQVSLLRAIQEGVVRRVGGEKPVRVDVRIVAATHRDLRAEIAEKKFREDLFYRLNGATLRVPPLRERPEDLEPLVRAFLAEAGRAGLSVTTEAWRALQRHPWSGNVRELRSEVFRWAVFCDQRVRVADLTLEGGGDSLDPASLPASPVRSLATAIADTERQLVTLALADSSGNISKAARALSIDRNTLKRKIATFALARPRNA